VELDCCIAQSRKIVYVLSTLVLNSTDYFHNSLLLCFRTRVKCASSVRQSSTMSADSFRTTELRFCLFDSNVIITFEVLLFRA